MTGNSGSNGGNNGGGNGGNNGGSKSGNDGGGNGGNNGSYRRPCWQDRRDRSRDRDTTKKCKKNKPPS